MEMKGFTYGFNGLRGEYQSQEGIKSQELLFETGVNWMCLAFPIYQKKFSSSEIYFDYRRTVTDKDIIETINRAHKNHVKVCLKPMINCDDGIWRALIDFPDEDMHGQDRYWNEWFEFYTAFLVHYAEIAEQTKCKMFCMGCEMCKTERKSEHWRSAISAVRKVYNGPLVYNTNHGKEDSIEWFDDLDYIGTSAYFPVGKKPGASKEEMVVAWKRIAANLKPISEKFGKKFVFMEIGCRSAEGCAMMPWDFTHMKFPWSEEEQGNFYDSCLEVFSKEEWFEGVFWWDWSTKIYDTKEEANSDLGFNIHLKKAEEVIKKWYKEIG